MKLADKARFIADTKAAGASVRGLGTEADRTGRLFSQGAHHGFLWNQMLFTLRRTIYQATLALAAMGAAAIVAGFHFNTMIEQQQLAFSTMMHSASGARREVQFLFNLAAHGPFQFEQVIQGARQLQAFGYQAKQTNSILTALQDAMAGMGLDQAGLDRATLALGEIRSIGVLQGRQVRQLEQLGLLNREVLAKGLGISTEQAGLIGNLRIPWQRAIDVITAYWVRRFHGASQQFQRTWIGLWSTFKDLGSQAMGAVTQPLFRRIERGFFPGANRTLQDISTYYNRAGSRGSIAGALGVVNRDTGVDLVGDWRAFVFVMRQAAGILTTLISIWTAASGSLHLFQGVFLALGSALFIVNHLLMILKYPLMILTALWLLNKGVLITLTAVEYGKIAADKIMWVWTNRNNIATILQTRLMRLQLVQLFRVILGWRAWAFAEEEVFVRGQGVYAQQLVNMGLFARMSRFLFTSMVPSLAAVTAGTWLWITSLTVLEAVGLLAGLAALGAAIYLIATHWNTVVSKTKEAFEWMNRVAHFKLLPTQAKDLPFGLGEKAGFGFHNPFRGLATGGRTTSAGMIMVGERGPELLSVPSGASVVPLGNAPLASLGTASLSGSSAARKLYITVPVMLDRRKLAEANASVELDDLTRA